MKFSQLFPKWPFLLRTSYDIITFHGASVTNRSFRRRESADRDSFRDGGERPNQEKVRATEWADAVVRAIPDELQNAEARRPLFRATPCGARAGRKMPVTEHRAAVN